MTTTAQVQVLIDDVGTLTQTVINKVDSLESTVNSSSAAIANKVDASKVLTDVPYGAVFTDTLIPYIHPESHLVSEISGLQALLDDKVTNAQVLTNVPVDAVFTDTEYEHPAQHAISEVTGLQAILDSIGTFIGDLAYESRGDAKNLSPSLGDMINIAHIGRFNWYPTQDEPEDDETCFNTDTVGFVGQWLLVLPCYDLLEAHALVLNSFRNELDEDEELRFSTYLTNQGVM